MRRKTPTIFFNASVILSGLYSPTGGSSKLLEWSKRRKIQGIVSETVADEVLTKSPKLDLNPASVKRRMAKIFPETTPAPTEKIVQKYLKTIIDPSDAHVLASCEESGANYLVSLDKKHILLLKKKVKKFKILSPGELIQILAEK